MNQKRIILQGALILTVVGFISRIIGFFYRIFLSHAIGAEGVGIYQLIFPVYSMAFSLTASGIQTAISRNVSGKMALGDKRGARDVFAAGLILTLGGTALASLFLYYGASWISSSLLNEARCVSLIRVLAFALPFAGVHSCVGGYFLGLKKTGVPAVSQLVEQTARVSVSFLAYLILLEKGMQPTPMLAVTGLFFEEAVSALFCMTAALLHFRKSGEKAEDSHISLPFCGILQLSWPLTANRVLINLLQSVEAVCIPLRLQLSGLAVSSALGVYGVLTGMALPMVLFPSAVTSAISMMLLPTVSEAQASGSSHRISRTLEGTVKYSLTLGILCTGVFLCFGDDMGALLFDSPLAGKFILIMAWICPFMYLGSTLASILNGMGKTAATFWQNALSLLIRILFVWFAIPRFGIAAYLWGLLVSQLFSAAAALISLARLVPFRFDSSAWIVKPVLALGMATGIMFFFRSALIHFEWKILPAAEMLISVCILSAVYIFITFRNDLLTLVIPRILSHFVLSKS